MSEFVFDKSDRLLQTCAGRFWGKENGRGLHKAPGQRVEGRERDDRAFSGHSLAWRSHRRRGRRAKVDEEIIRRGRTADRVEVATVAER